MYRHLFDRKSAECSGLPLLLTLIWLSLTASSAEESVTAVLPSHSAVFGYACKQSEALENVRWLFRDSQTDRHRAFVRGIIIRAVSRHRVRLIRQGFNEGQKQNENARKSLELCDDHQVWLLAHQVSEEFRLKSCSGAQPARSATCGDLKENLRWSMLDSGGCAKFARGEIIEGIDSLETLDVRADHIRQGVKVAESHNQEVWDSTDWIADELLVRIAIEVVKNGM